MRGDYFLDTRNVFDSATVESGGLRYECIGRHHPVARVAVSG